MSEPMDPRWGVGDLIQFINRYDKLVYGVVVKAVVDEGQLKQYKIHWFDDDQYSMENPSSISSMNKVS